VSFAVAARVPPGDMMGGVEHTGSSGHEKADRWDDKIVAKLRQARDTHVQVEHCPSILILCCVIAGLAIAGIHVRTPLAHIYMT